MHTAVCAFCVRCTRARSLAAADIRVDIREGMVAILSCYVHDPQFQGQTKERLNNPEAAAQLVAERDSVTGPFYGGE